MSWQQTCDVQHWVKKTSPEDLELRPCVVKHIKSVTSGSFCLAATVNPATLLAAWNVSSEDTREDQSAVCSIVISSSAHPTPDHFLCFPRVSQAWTGSRVSVRRSPARRVHLNPRMWCYSFAITVEMSLFSFSGYLWWKERVKWRSFIVSTTWDDGSGQTVFFFLPQSMFKCTAWRRSAALTAHSL